MEPPFRHRERCREDCRGSCLMRPILPWRDSLMNWDRDDYRFGDKGAGWDTPSLTSGSSQPSTLCITPEADSKWENTQTPSIDPSIARIALDADTQWDSAYASGYSTSDDLLTKDHNDYEEDFNSGSQYNLSLLNRFELARLQSDVDFGESDNFLGNDYEDGENSSDDESEWSEEDCSLLEMLVVSAIPGDRPLAAHLIPILNRDYYIVSQSNTTQRVGPWREDVTSGEKSFQSPAESGTTEAHHVKRRRNTGSDGGDDEDEEDGGDDEDKRKPKRMKGTFESEKGEPNVRLACPFHKKDPAKYNIQFDEAGGEPADRTKKTEFRACAGPGFKNVQRLKEHLKRKHYPVQCDRCYMIFPGSRPGSITELESHRQLDIPCERKDSSLKEGISDAQWAQLDKKPSSKDSIGTSIVEKWNHIWTVLFPDTPVPSTPWYETLSREPTLPHEETRPFLEIFRHMLDSQVTQQDIQFPKESEEDMKGRVVTLVGQAFAVYTALHGSSSNNSTSTRSLGRSSTIPPIFSITSDRRRRASTMSSTSAPSSAVSMDSSESLEGYSPAVYNITSNPSAGVFGHIVESPLPSSDLDLLPRIQGALSRADLVVHRLTPGDEDQGPGHGHGQEESGV